jgi:Mobilization protein NikA
MSAPPRDFAEPALARDAPAIIHLPHLPPPIAEKKRPKRQRGHVEQFRTDAGEHAALAALAEAAGLSLGAYFRRELIGSAGVRARRAPPTEASRLRARHITAINRAGNLINQGIRALHDAARRAPEADSRDRLAEEITATRELLEGALPALREALAAAVAGDDHEG